MYDSFGDGWNGNSIDIIVDGVVVLDDVTLASGSFGSLSFPVSCGSVVDANIDWNGSWDSEVSYEIFNQDGASAGAASYFDNIGLPNHGDLEDLIVTCAGGPTADHLHRRPRRGPACRRPRVQLHHHLVHLQPDGDMDEPS